MKKIICCFVFCALMLCLTATSYASLSQFADDWKNVNPNTRGITKIKTLVRGTKMYVQAWGKCHPRDCDWGTVKAYAYGPNVSANLSAEANALTAVFRSGFSETLMVIRPSGRDRLSVSVYTHFTDNSRRTDYSSYYTFSRSYSDSMPRQLAPANGTVFNHYPRRTILKWTTVPGAKSYGVEYQYKYGNTWSGSIKKDDIQTNSYTFNFVGAQPGRWRVWAVKNNGQSTPKTGWWEFRYTR